MIGPRRIAMWSGPRNISTAMMRAWENRGDCAVSDEPLYAHYLAATGIDHPGRDEVIAAGEADWRKVVTALIGPVPEGKPLWYQKHMSHHLLPGMAHDWIHALDNVFLIRDPDEVVASYVKKRASVTPADLGVPQELRLFEELAERHCAAGDRRRRVPEGAGPAAAHAVRAPGHRLQRAHATLAGGPARERLGERRRVREQVEAGLAEPARSRHGGSSTRSAGA
jgi:hypothetical protein